MNDLQVFKLVDVIESVPVGDSVVNGRRVVILRLFTPAEKVGELTVNGNLVDSFVVKNANELAVTLPKALLEVPLQELHFLLLSTEQTDLPLAYEILFDIGKIPRKATGTSYLVQKWIRFLLTSSGTDCFDTSAGAGLLDIAGSVSPTGLAGVKAQVAKICHDCKQQIISRQLRRARARPSEVLKDAWVAGIGLDLAGKLVVRTVLVDATGAAVSAALKV